jgi:hypothetical protein
MLQCIEKKIYNSFIYYENTQTFSDSIAGFADDRYGAAGE